MKSKRKKEKLLFEKLTIVSLNKKEMIRVKGGGFPPEVIGSDTPKCGDLTTYTT